MGWLILKNRETTRRKIVSRYAKDILQDPFYAWLEQNFSWVWIVLMSWCGFFVGGILVELLCGGGAKDALQSGLSFLIWGVFVRTVLVWHITWSVNSVGHLWGYRNYNGEGWHNNHHADPRSARHGHLWWEVDVTWLTIRLLVALGLARAVVTPTHALLALHER